MQKKYINEIMIALIVISGLSVIVSAAMMVSAVKKLASASGESAVSVSIPLLSKRSDVYALNDYKSIQKKIDSTASVLVEAKQDQLVISAQNITDEIQWRRAVSDALALDRNLHARKVCGSVANACTGAALMAEIVGQRQVVFINQEVNQEGVAK